MAAFSGLDVTRAYGLDFLFPARDWAIGASLRNHGEFARPIVDALAALLDPGKALIDVGANIGAIALPVAARRPASSVIAVEASRPLATILAANALGNRLENVTVVHAAAGREVGLATFPAPVLDRAANFGGFRSGAQDAEMPVERVRVCTLDELAPSGGVGAVKIDVEGFEAEVLAGAERLLREDRPAWLVETTADEAGRAVRQTFLDAGYSLHWLFAPFVTPSAPKGWTAGGKIGGDANFIALPPGREPPFEMPPIRSADEVRPADATLYPYLRDYGF